MYLMSIWFSVHMLLMPLQESICCYFDSMSRNVLVNNVIDYKLDSHGLVLTRSRDFPLCHHVDWPWVLADHSPERGAQ
jgi:hypothetical protein